MRISSQYCIFPQSFIEIKLLVIAKQHGNEPYYIYIKYNQPGAITLYWMVRPRQENDMRISSQ